MVFYAKGVVLNIPIVVDYQRYFYFQNRSLVQTDPNCVEYDKKLLYILKNGECKFNNVEFRTSILVSHGNRVIARSNIEQPKQDSNRLFVLGDSYAFGWGVESSQSFSYFLQKESKFDVRNLSVPSYGTYREITKLIEGYKIDRQDILILQYCINDLSENQKFLSKINEKAVSQDIFSKSLVRNSSKKKIDSTDFIKKAFTIPINRFLNFYLSLKNQNILENQRRYDFSNVHQKAMLKILNESKLPSDLRILVLVFDGRDSNDLKFTENPEMSSRFNLHILNLKLSRNDYFVLDDHWNSRGHKEVFRQISMKMTQLGW